jgi:TonB family protein
MSRILPFLVVASALSAQVAPPTPPTLAVKAIRLKVAGSPANPALAIDPKEVLADLRAFFAGRGIPVAPEGKDAPEGTFELEVSAIALRYSEGTCLLSVSEWLAPASAKVGPAKKNAQGWSGTFMAAQAGEKGLINQTRAAVLDVAAVLLKRATGEKPSINPVPAPTVQANVPSAPLPAAVDATPPPAKVKVQPPPPPYPALALDRKVEGTVVVLLTLDPDGRPVRAVAASGPAELKATALRYAMQWIFEPIKLNGKPVSAQIRLPIPFILGG